MGEGVSAAKGREKHTHTHTHTHTDVLIHDVLTARATASLGKKRLPAPQLHSSLEGVLVHSALGYAYVFCSHTKHCTARVVAVVVGGVGEQ